MTSSDFVTYPIDGFDAGWSTKWSNGSVEVANPGGTVYTIETDAPARHMRWAA